MKSESNKLLRTIIPALLLLATLPAIADTIPTGWKRPLQWHLGAEVSPAFVAGTNSFLKGHNPLDRCINGSFAGALRAGFSFAPDSREGLLYKGLYQGIGLGITSFNDSGLLGTPFSAYVYQGAPIARLNHRLWLGYEWKFGAAFGWKHDFAETPDGNAPVSTSVTAHMGLGLKLHYRLTPACEIALGIEATHFSNGNTSLPNAGVNTIRLSAGIACTLGTPAGAARSNPQLEAEADRPCWLYDITAYGAWRRRIVSVGEPPEPTLCPGRFGVLGLQFSPLRRLNRWVAAGPSLDMRWDESAGLAPYWAEGSSGENIRFTRPPFGKQISVGVSAHAELTMPIFSINAGLGYDFINPKGDRRFYQTLTLKTFLTDMLYLNTGYRLGKFNTPENLMLGVGIRIK